MFKNVIAPIQSWLLSRGQCVGCGTALAKGERAKHQSTGAKVTCKCGRIYIYDNAKKTYRRALFSEL